MADISFLSETFDIYIKKAKEANEHKDYVTARKFYLLAAQQMLKMAKESSPELKKSRLSRAKNLENIADSLPVPESTNASSLENDSGISNVKIAVSLDDALAELNSLIGLNNVKNKVFNWVEQIKVFKLRKEKGLPVPDITYHMVFTGNPGTGKTTVARIISKIYKALGIISGGQLVEVDRSDLVAGYIGQTAIKAKNIIKKAKGGVLFIDEAYSLNNGGENDFGREAIDTILKHMEDNRDDFVVIVAGYQNLMAKFISSNPGLESRFKNFINFEDYNADDLYKIFVLNTEKNQYKIEDAAHTYLKAYFLESYKKRNHSFANARHVRNLFEDIIAKQSVRVSHIDSPTNDDLITIKVEDLTFKIDGSGNIKNSKTSNDSLKPENAIMNKDIGPTKYNWDSLPEISFNDIAGLKEVKEEVKIKVLLPLKSPDLFKGYGKKSGGGLFLYGPPGTGKTMIAAAIANEIGAKFCSIKPSDLLSTGFGSSEKNIKQLFLEARKYPISVIYFDEIDSITPKSSGSTYAKHLRSEFLSQLQGMDSYSNNSNNLLFLISSTNKPWDVDSAFLRPGRFGTKIYIGLPDAEAREYMFNERINKVKKEGIVLINNDIDISQLVNKTEGYNGADISNLLDKAMESSALRSLKDNKKIICMEDFNIALSKIHSSVQKSDIAKILDWKEKNNF